MKIQIKLYIFSLINLFCVGLLRAQLVFGIGSPLHLNFGSTEIVLTDYVTDISKIDSVTFHSSIKKIPVKKKNSITIIAEPLKVPAVSVMKIWSKGKSEAVPVFKSRKESKVITFDASGKEYKKVQIAGDFNSWNPEKSNFSFNNGKWYSAQTLNPGKYAYQLVLDGKWTTDKSNPDSIPNGMGAFNSVLRVGKSMDVLPHLFTKSFVGKNLELIGIKGKSPDTLIVFINNELLDAKRITKKDNLFSIKLDDNHSGWLRIYGYNRIGLANDLLIPVKNGLHDPSSISKSNYSMQMYFVLTDRFNNGNKQNDKPLLDKDIHEKANYQGGDLAGITAKIKDGYFKSLGINTLWISPIVQNPEIGYIEFPEPKRKYSGYHGYWPVSCSKIDHRFGTSEELKELVKIAHENNIKILLDFVANHVHEEHPLYKNHKEWTTPVDLPDGRKNIRIWDEQRLTTWFDTFLPDLDYTKPEVINAMTDSAIWWIKTYNLDGFRHDATKHVSEDFWRALTLKLKKEFPQKNIYQIGETFGSRELIAGYVCSGQQDAQFDFNTYFDAREIFAGTNTDFNSLKGSLQETFSYYGYHHLMGNISGNHDLARFISYAGDAMTFSEDDKKAGWSRNIEVKNKNGYRKLILLHAFNYTIPGVPITYYGDEFGMPGAGDPDNRRFMKFEGWNENENKVKEKMSELSKWRTENNALQIGETYFLKAEKGTMSYIRHYFDENILVVFNNKEEPCEIEISIPEVFLPLKNAATTTKLKLEPFSYEIIKL